MRFAVITFILLFVGAAARCIAQEQPASSRILKTFNFDERKVGNDEDQPMNWNRLEGPEFPHYVQGQITTDRHRAGACSFRMDLDGGNCTYRYHPGLLKIQPGAHYRFEGYCQTSVLRYARARLTAYFTDQDQHPLLNTTRHSELFASNGADDEWHSLSVELTADRDRASFLVVQMELLQPSQYSTSTLGQRSLFLQDVHGSAWFSDLTVAQVPQVVLKTDRPGNVFRSDDPLKLTVQVNDQETDDLAVQLVVTDALDRRIYQHTGSIDITTAKTVALGVRELSLDLPGVPPGWYRASLIMMSHGVYVGQESLAWIRLADDGDLLPPDPRFCVNATDLPYNNWDQLPKFLPLLSVGRVKLPMWTATGDVQQSDAVASTSGNALADAGAYSGQLQLGTAGRLDPLLQALQAEGIAPVGCLLALPPKIAESLNGSNWLQVLNAPLDTWQTPLAFLISRHANHIDHWQLGVDDSEEFALSPDLRKVYTKVNQQFAELVDHPDLAMPCPILYDLPSPAPSSITLSIPPEIIPAEIPLYVKDYRGRDQQAISLSLTLLDPNQYPRETRLRDMAQRVVYALASDQPKIDLPLPLISRQQGDEMIAEPLESAIIMRTLLATLSGARFMGIMPVKSNVDAFLFEKTGQGIVVLWNKDDVTDPQPVDINLGEHPVAMDLWGNARPMVRLSTAARDDDESSNRRSAGSGLVRLKIGRMPIIVTGIDGQMGRLRCSLGFDQPLIESSFQTHTRHIHFTNPYSQPIGGTLKIHAPTGWVLSPPSFTFTLNGGETFDRELTVDFPYNSICGPHTFTADFDVQADRHLAFSEPLALTLGLSDVGTQCMAFRDGADVVVQQMITNYGEQPITYSAFANYPSRPRIERLVTSLNPGQTTLKKYRFRSVPTNQVSRVRVGLKEVDGNRLLNDEVEIK